MIDLAEFNNQRILILGLGREGLATLHLFLDHLSNIDLTVADQKPLDQLNPIAQEFLTAHPQLHQQLGTDYLNHLNSFDTIFRSPGIPPFLPELQSADIKSKLSSETKLFFAKFPGTIIGITGSKGKSTTTKLIYDILTHAGKSAVLVGNIGEPAIKVLPTTTADTIAVYELSSHQLYDLDQSPHIAVLLNIFPEHLDYYPDFDTYKQAKANIAMHQSPTDYLIYDPGNSSLQNIVSQSKAKQIHVGTPKGSVLIQDQTIFTNSDNQLQPVISMADIPLLGNHNLINVIHAIAATSLLDVSPSQQAEAIKSFQPLPHRLQPVGEYRGIKFYNDSLSTNPEAAIQALNAVPQVSTLIIGGSDRKRSYEALAQAIGQSSVTTVIVLAANHQGFTTPLQQFASQVKILSAQNMSQAVSMAYQHTPPGSTCLLSPGAPSFDLFTDYQDRGHQFIENIKLLA